MISALQCAAYSMLNIEKYCSEYIEPLLLKANGSPIYYGKYNSEGTQMYYISKIYAKDPPELTSLGPVEVSPFLIKKYLESLGYVVKFCQVLEKYPIGQSASKRTTYYPAGCISYYSLKISF